MKQTNSFKFVSLEDVQAKILEIPYKGEELSMMVLLPNEVDGVHQNQSSRAVERVFGK